MALPDRQDLELYRGDTASVTFRLWEDAIDGTPTDLDGATARAQIRDVPGGTLLAELGVVILLPNEINVTMPAGAWDAFPRRSSASWDLQLTYAGGVIRTLIAGAVLVSGDVTLPLALVG